MLISGTEVMPHGLYWPFPKEQVNLSFPRTLLSLHKGKNPIASEILLCTHLLPTLPDGNLSLQRFLDALYKSCLTSSKRFYFPCYVSIIFITDFPMLYMNKYREEGEGGRH